MEPYPSIYTVPKWKKGKNKVEKFKFGFIGTVRINFVFPGETETYISVLSLENNEYLHRSIYFEGKKTRRRIYVNA